MLNKQWYILNKQWYIWEVSVAGQKIVGLDLWFPLSATVKRSVQRGQIWTKMICNSLTVLDSSGFDSSRLPKSDVLGREVQP